jgi:hypothetical protein
MSRHWVVRIFVSMALVDTPCEAFDLVEPLSPGGETLFTVSVANPTTSSIASVSFESSPVVAPGAYVLESWSSPICEIQNGVLDEHVPVVLSIAPLPARSTVHCSLKMRRLPTSDGPAGLGFEPSASTPTGISLSAFDWVFGPVMDLSLHVEQIRPLPTVGERTGFVRVSVHNTGPGTSTRSTSATARTWCSRRSNWTTHCRMAAPTQATVLFAGLWASLRSSSA